MLGVHLTRDWSGRPPEEIWRQPVGAGWSSFAVVGRFAVTQEQRGDEELVVCYDIPTGGVRWVHTNEARFSEKMGGDGPRATPTIAGGRVYALAQPGFSIVSTAPAARSSGRAERSKKTSFPT